MKLAKVRLMDGEMRIAIVEDDAVRLLDLTQVENCDSLSDVLHHKDPRGLANFLIDTTCAPLDIEDVSLLAPIDNQEVWAAGVTYKRSQQARMDESETAASHYDLVYSADRPELFYKANARRVSGPHDPVRVRFDSKWSVPEPEFTLVVSPEMKIVGYTIGNDMSARDIEGENPLYLPQAKVYSQCCSLGPVVWLPDSFEQEAIEIEITIRRNGREAFQGKTGLDQLARKLTDLVNWLGRENEFPDGVFLLTGTGIVPPDDFTLENGDIVSITISGIGTLTNPVVKDS